SIAEARSRSVIPFPEAASGLSDFIGDFSVLGQAVEDSGHSCQRIPVARVDFLGPLLDQRAYLLRSERCFRTHEDQATDVRETLPRILLSTAGVGRNFKYVVAENRSEAAKCPTKIADPLHDVVVLAGEFLEFRGNHSHHFVYRWVRRGMARHRTSTAAIFLLAGLNCCGSLVVFTTFDFTT